MCVCVCVCNYIVYVCCSYVYMCVFGMPLDRHKASYCRHQVQVCSDITYCLGCFYHFVRAREYWCSKKVDKVQVTSYPLWLQYNKKMNLLQIRLTTQSKFAKQHCYLTNTFISAVASNSLMFILSKLLKWGFLLYRTQENFGREKLVNLANCELFTKILLPMQYSQILKKVCLAYALTVTLFAKFFLTNSFYL